MVDYILHPFLKKERTTPGKLLLFLEVAYSTPKNLALVCVLGDTEGLPFEGPQCSKRNFHHLHHLHDLGALEVPEPPAWNPVQHGINTKEGGGGRELMSMRSFGVLHIPPSRNCQPKEVLKWPVRHN